MKPLFLFACALYFGLALGGYARIGILRAVWKYVFREMFPEMLSDFWEVYPGRRWPGPLKLIGLPLTFVFLLTAATTFVLFFVVVLVVLSPLAIWRLFFPGSRSRPSDPDQPPPAVAARMRAAG